MATRARPREGGRAPRATAGIGNDVDNKEETKVAKGLSSGRRKMDDELMMMRSMDRDRCLALAYIASRRIRIPSTPHKVLLHNIIA